MKFNAIDLFCGAGGLSSGFFKAGINILLGVDSNEKAIETFKINHKEAKSYSDDIRNLTLGKLKRLCEKKKIHLVIGGPPCQGFSMAGKRKPSDPRNSLFKEYIRIVEGIKPDMCLMENVRGLLSMITPKKRKVIDVILDEFRMLKYDANCYSINTADYGVPQKRHRIFIIAKRKKISFNFPEPSYSSNGKNNAGKKVKKWKSIRNILASKSNVEAKYFYSDRLIKGFKRRETKNKERGMGFGWKFLNPEEPSYTISARYYKDGAEALIRYSNNEIRMLTPEECALIQTFPKSYKFQGGKINQYKQVGNAVPPLMGFVIGKAIKESLINRYCGNKARISVNKRTK